VAPGEDAHIPPMMGFQILEPLPTRSVPYERVDPFILVHASRLRLSELNDVDTKRPHRGFDNLWCILEGSATTRRSSAAGAMTSSSSSSHLT
jgi:redox-sensitive bicupin YhaK (pirin superfamily)